MPVPSRTKRANSAPSIATNAVSCVRHAVNIPVTNFPAVLAVLGIKVLGQCLQFDRPVVELARSLVALLALLLLQVLGSRHRRTPYATARATKSASASITFK